MPSRLPNAWVVLIKSSHEDVLHNLGIHSRGFIEQNGPLVTEMTRKFLDYVKTARLEAADSENANNKGADSERIDIRMTTDGYPIIPKLVMDRNLKKAEWEKLLRAFLSQHYCAYDRLMHIRSRAKFLQILPVERSQNRFLTAECRWIQKRLSKPSTDHRALFCRTRGTCILMTSEGSFNIVTIAKRSRGPSRLSVFQFS